MLFLTPMPSTESVALRFVEAFNPQPVGSDIAQDLPLSAVGADILDRTDEMTFAFDFAGSVVQYTFEVSGAALRAATEADPFTYTETFASGDEVLFTLYQDDGDVKWKSVSTGANAAITIPRIVSITFDATYTGCVLTNEAESGSVLTLAPGETITVEVDLVNARVIWMLATDGLRIASDAGGGGQRTWDGAGTNHMVAAPNPNGAYFVRMSRGEGGGHNQPVRRRGRDHPPHCGRKRDSRDGSPPDGVGSLVATGAQDGYAGWAGVPGSRTGGAAPV